MSYVLAQALGISDQLALVQVHYIFYFFALTKSKMHAFFSTSF